MVQFIPAVNPEADIAALFSPEDLERAILVLFRSVDR
jgi:hypothetical protein